MMLAWTQCMGEVCVMEEQVFLGCEGKTLGHSGEGRLRVEFSA